MLQKCNKFDIIVVDSKPDCADFRGIYDGLDGDILINPSAGKVRAMLRVHQERPLIICGHGSERGLFNKDWNGMLVDSRMVDMLRKRSCIIGVWCYAGNFADKYGLHGFFTSMFISNMTEALECGFPNATPEDITRENILFSKRLNKLLKENLYMLDGKPLINDWPWLISRKADISKGFVRYNYEAMSVF